jgi:hypothetical protein
VTTSSGTGFAGMEMSFMGAFKANAATAYNSTRPGLNRARPIESLRGAFD